MDTPSLNWIVVMLVISTIVIGLILGDLILRMLKGKKDK